MSDVTTTATVIIPHYGDPGPALALVEALNASPVHQIIVCDDCSPVPFPHIDGVHLVRRQINGGFAAAVNAAARDATGDYLLVLNSDLEIPPSFPDELLRAAIAQPPAILGPRVLDTEGRITYSARHWPSTLNQTLEWLTPLARWRETRWLRRLLGHDVRVLDATEPIEVDWLVGAAFLMPTSEFRAAGGLDERFHMNSEEIDLQRRLAERGVKRIYVPSVSVTHEGGGSSEPAKRRRWLVTSQFRYAEKWGGSKRLRVALTAATVVNFAWNCVRRLRGAHVHPVDVAQEELALVWNQPRPNATHESWASP
ncbi:glycosyltransferase family 2 protein [Tessaracoccus sp. G1721]